MSRAVAVAVVLAGAVLGAAPSACTPQGTLIPAADARLHAVEAFVLEALPVACTVADALDPALFTVVCGVLDEADNVLTTRTLVCPAKADAAAMVAAHPASAAVAAKLAPLASLAHATTYGARR